MHIHGPALGATQPPIQWVPGALSLGVKWPGREADHSPLSSAELKNGGAIPPPPYVFMALCFSAVLIKYRDNFIYTDRTKKGKRSFWIVMKRTKNVVFWTIITFPSLLYLIHKITMSRSQTQLRRYHASLCDQTEFYSRLKSPTLPALTPAWKHKRTTSNTV
jgi:hypothetical protein